MANNRRNLTSLTSRRFAAKFDRRIRNNMTSRERLLTAAAFQEPDRVPIELYLGQKARELPETRRIVEFIDAQADNFIDVPGADWGFFGLDSQYSEEIIEDRPGEFRRIRRNQRTQAGDFYAITKHFYPHIDSPDYHWERRYIHSLDDLERLAEGPRTTRRIFAERQHDSVVRIGDRGVPIMGLAHPLGALVRQANMEEVYIWLVSEPSIVHHFLDRANAQVRDTICAMGQSGISGWFVTYAHEMLIPPWMGMRLFDEVVFPYDKMVNDAIHGIGGRHRSHCHGNSMHFLRRMSEMGVDATEPMEPPPFGDVDLREAKRQVGDRMLLSGNIPSQAFVHMSRKDVHDWVRKAISVAAPSGGFTLHTTGGHAGVDPDLDKDTLRKIIENVHAYIEAGMKFGTYPIRP